MKKKTRRLKITLEEKLIIFVIILSISGLFATQIFFGAQISNTKMEIEKIDYRIETQEKKNESLTMQVNELTSYENIDSVLQDMGLAYNNENIIVLDK